MTWVTTAASSASSSSSSAAAAAAAASSGGGGKRAKGARPPAAAAGAAGSPPLPSGFIYTTDPVYDPEVPRRGPVATEAAPVCQAHKRRYTPDGRLPMERHGWKARTGAALAARARICSYLYP